MECPVIPANSQCQVLIMLDRQVALESLVLNRLQNLPDDRQQEWLRGLLLDGFRLACHVLQVASSETKIVTPNDGSKTSARQHQPAVTSRPESMPQPEIPVCADKQNHRHREPAAGQSKPFAQLRKVVGS